MGNFRIMRAYDEPDGGFRVLIDRLWPRGLAKERGEFDDWAKDAAPSPSLRVAFSHKAERFEEFSEHYVQELDAGGAAAGADRLLELAAEHPDVVLVFAARDQVHNHAVVLLDYLNQRQREQPETPAGGPGDDRGPGETPVQAPRQD